MPGSQGSKAALRVLGLLPLILVIGFAPAPASAQELYERFIRDVTIDKSDEVAALLARGMDPNTVDANGDPVLLIAARSGFEPTLDALLTAGAKVNVRNPYGDSAIMVAAISGRLPIVKKLLARGAAINHPGWTPLIYAATGGHADVARYLIDAGADVNAASPNGTTALMMAVRGGHAAVVDLLLARRADVGHRNDDGATALAWAKRGGFDAIERALRRSGANN
jgi:ankyrin repeat protein